MRGFYFVLLTLLLVKSGIGQNCEYHDVIKDTAAWTGDISSFTFGPEGMQLKTGAAGKSDLTFYPDSHYQTLFLSFSLDFPPSPANQFELSVYFGTGTRSTGQISMVIGETGDSDGVIIEVRENDSLKKDHYFWSGKYGRGADRAQWILTLEKERIVLTDPVSNQIESIPLGFTKGSIPFIEKIQLQCRYTKTRSDRFYFHQVQLWPDSYPSLERISTGDVFFTEVLAGGSVNHPFIEIYNTLPVESCITGLSVKINDLIADLPPLQLSPFQYIALVAEQFPKMTENFLKVEQLSILHSTEKDLKTVELRHYGRLIHQMMIPDALNQESSGSWEMMDILQPCRLDNWTLSEVAGGTPGRENTVFGSLDRPRLQLEWISPDEAEVIFPYVMPDLSLLISLIKPGSEWTININSDRPGSVQLYFNRSAVGEEPFPLHVRGGVIHCGGKDSWDTIVMIHMPVWPKRNDVLITELMYDPPRGCPEYLEISVLAGVPVWLGGLNIQRADGMHYPLELPVKNASHYSWVITKDRDEFLGCYPETDLAVIVEGDLFILPNTGSTLRLTNDAGNFELDHVAYDGSWHHPGFRDLKGITLERDYHRPESGEWRSGYHQHSYRSPGFLPDWTEEDENELIFSASSLRLGAGSDGKRLEIQWGHRITAERGFLTIDIYDIQGNKVNQLTNSIPIQGGEVFYWEGYNENGQLLKEGVYLFWIYYFDNIGRKKIYKRTCVLSHQ